MYEGSTKVHPKDLNLVFLGPDFALGPGWDLLRNSKVQHFFDSYLLSNAHCHSRAWKKELQNDALCVKWDISDWNHF